VLVRADSLHSYCRELDRGRSLTAKFMHSISDLDPIAGNLLVWYGESMKIPRENTTLGLTGAFNMSDGELGESFGSITNAKAIR